MVSEQSCKANCRIQTFTVFNFCNMLACARPVGYKLLQSQGFLYKVAKKSSNPLKNQNLIVLG